MAIETVVTRGFGNGTFTGTIALVTLHGYGIAQVVDVPATFEVGIGYCTPESLLHYVAPFQEMSFSVPQTSHHYDAPVSG